jgi:hypothetical protein
MRTDTGRRSLRPHDVPDARDEATGAGLWSSLLEARSEPIEQSRGAPLMDETRRMARLTEDGEPSHTA